MQNKDALRAKVESDLLERVEMAKSIMQALDPKIKSALGSDRDDASRCFRAQTPLSVGALVACSSCAWTSRNFACTRYSAGIVVKVEEDGEHYCVALNGEPVSTFSEKTVAYDLVLAHRCSLVEITF